MIFYILIILIIIILLVPCGRDKKIEKYTPYDISMSNDMNMSNELPSIPPSILNIKKDILQYTGDVAKYLILR